MIHVITATQTGESLRRAVNLVPARIAVFNHLFWQCAPAMLTLFPRANRQTADLAMLDGCRSGMALLHKSVCCASG
ncbi:hypothetical protein WN982_30740 [Paraburkholderia sp. IMGN_8]|uniref:hypothetical protein n=1 Tax=Paraburkholderia sp. IMGN_8 TaxID=3136564 RepID=UPI0031014B3E